MSKAVTSLSVSAVQSQLKQQRNALSERVQTVFRPEAPITIPSRIRSSVEKIATSQINQLTLPPGAEIVIVVSSRGTIQIYRKNPDDTIGRLIMETGMTSDTED
ncbi:MAG: hypothetical protein JG718_10175 [Candidatus Thiothrix moscowensis]|nr:hypothetical protein [Candidatus Thiothrix moscowensis]